MPFSQVPMTLKHKATLWFALLLLVISAPPAGEVGSTVPTSAGVQQVVWANSTLAARLVAIKLGNSGVPGSCAISTKRGNFANGSAPSGSLSPDSAGLGTAIIWPEQGLELVAEIQAFPPGLSVAARHVQAPCARGPPVNFVGLS